MLAWIGLIGVAALGVALAAIGVPQNLMGAPDGAVADVVQIAGLVLCICTALFMGFRDNAGLAYRQTSIWLSILLVGASAYSYRAELISIGIQTAEDLVPGITVAEDAEDDRTSRGPRLLAVRANKHGQFDVDTLINGTHVSMLADTGATLVTLTSEDARRIGFDVNALIYDIPLRTANGITHGAKVDIDELDVGGILVRRVAAIISKPDVLHRSLLGMSYFREIGSFQLSGDQLVLRE